tara:strand:- start:5649 stop:6224 length:576 start_codon:yes stop_codon:yes gene_type:complete
MSEAESRTKITDWYLDEEDKEFILAKKGSKQIRAFPGSEKFLLYSEAKKVKEFRNNGAYSSVMGFGIDYFINRGFTSDWDEIEGRFEIIERTREILMDLVDDGHTFDESQLDKLYAWLCLTPFQTMYITDPIRKQLHKIVDIMWTSCVVKSKACSTHSNETAHTMMIDILNEWSQNVVIPCPGIGTVRLLK